MSNKRFWDDVLSRLDERLTDEAASDLFFRQQSRDVEVSEYISDTYNGISGKVRRRNSLLAFAACIAIVVCLSVVTVVILQNNIGVQPLDSSDEYSYLLEEVEYTHSIKVYFPSKEIGKEIIEYPEMLDNKLVSDAIETYLFAGNFGKEYYVFGNIENADELKKISFNDPIGGKTGMMREGWDISFSPTLLKSICDEDDIRVNCDKKYQNGTLKEKIEEITDIFMICIPEYPPLVHFKDRGKVYFINLCDNNLYGDGTPYGIYSQEELVEYFKMKDIPVHINNDEVLNGCARADGLGISEINITKLLEYVVDEKFIVREGSKTSYYMWDMKTGKKNLYIVTDSEAKTIETYYAGSKEPLGDNTYWNKNDMVTVFRDGDLFMNYKATDSLLAQYGIYFGRSGDSDAGFVVEYNETSNSFTSDTNFIALQNVGMTFNDYEMIYTNGDELCAHFSSRIPFSEIYNGLKIEYELVIKDNGKPVLINGKESYKFSTELKSGEGATEYEEYQDELYIDTAGITFNEYGYSTELVAYLTYTVDASRIISGRIETNTREDYLLIRNNPDNLTEEELIATTPVISKCKKQDTGVWAVTVDFSRIKKTDKDTQFIVQFIDEKNNKPVRMSNKVDNNKYLTIFSFGKDEEPVADIILYNEYEEPKLLLYMQAAGDDPINFYYRENFILTD
ncbi:MAG: hypothetical protein J6D27_00820 [Ruminiclostridium sp.]|nr:hypothetical protein [Ruminiclostridium sp.]